MEENKEHTDGVIQEDKVCVSVIVPVFNTERYIGECLNSVINQTLKEIEIIVVNDGSTDNSGNIISDFARKDSRIKVVNKENGGQSAARNLALKIAGGEYIQFLDSDDLLDENALQTLYSYSKENNLDQLFYDAQMFYETKELEAAQVISSSYYQRKGSYPDIESGKAAFVHMSTEGDFKPSAGPQFNRRKFLADNNISFCEGIIHEDDLFTMQSVLLAERVGVLNETYFYKRRVREGSTMTASGHMARSYGRFKVVYDLLKFLEDKELYKETELRKELEFRFLIELKSADRELADLDEAEIIDYAEHIRGGERESFLFAMYLADILIKKEKVFGETKKELNEFKQAFLRLGSPRIDLKSSGNSNTLEFSEFSDDKAMVKTAGWISDEAGEAYIVQSASLSGCGQTGFKILCRGGGNLSIILRGEYFKPEDEIIPYWIDYSDFKINGKTIFSETKCICHNKPFKYEMPVSDGDEIEISVSWKSHGMGERILENEAQRKINELNGKLQQTYQEKAERGIEIKELKAELSRIKNSRTYKLARALTAPVRKIKKIAGFRGCAG